MKKPPIAEPEALRAFEEIADSVAKKIRALETDLRLLQPTIAGIEDKLNTPDKKTSIQKAVHQMMMDDRRNRDRLKKANEHLDHAVEALRQVVFSEIERDEQRKIFTTKQIYDILRRQYFAQKREYLKSLDRTKQLKKKVISQNRALSMAEDLYLKGARRTQERRILRLRPHLAIHGHRKKLRAELRRLQKQETPSPQEQESLRQELERLDVLCQTPAAKEKIEEIAAGILRRMGTDAGRVPEEGASRQNPSATAYDDSFPTLLNDCRELIIPVVKEAFGGDGSAPHEEYAGHHAHSGGDARWRDGV